MSSYRMGNASAMAYSQIKAQGMTFIDKPDDELPEMPRDITDLTDTSLMTLYAEVVAWAEYSSSQMSAAVIDEKAAQRKADQAEALATSQLMLAGSSATAARNEAKLNQDVIDAYNYLFEAEAYRRMVETIVTSCDRNAAMISRELTRRTSGERQRRAGSTWTL